MKNKHIIISGGILLVLIAALYIKKTFVSPDIETEEYHALDIKLDIPAVQEIVVAKSGEEKLRLVKSEGFWRIPSKWNAKTDKGKAEGFLEQISVLSGELRSDSPEVLADYGIGDDKAFSVVFKGKEGVELGHFFIGTVKPGYDSSFLRENLSNKVYVVNKDIYGLLEIYGKPEEAAITVDNWLDRAVFNVDPEKVDTFEIKRVSGNREDVTVNIRKVPDEEKGLMKWVSGGEEPIFDIDAQKIKDYLTGLNNSRCSDILDPAGDIYGFEAPFLTITIGEGEAKAVYRVGNVADEKRKNRYMKDAGGNVFSVEGYYVDPLNIDISRFFINNPLRINMDKMNTIQLKTAAGIITLNKSDIANNNAYIDKLKGLTVKNMFYGDRPDEAASSPDNEVEITYEGDEKTSLKVRKVGEEYVAELSLKPGKLFILETTSFKNIFETLDSLRTTPVTES